MPSVLSSCLPRRRPAPGGGSFAWWDDDGAYARNRTSGSLKVKRAWQARQTLVVLSPRTETRPPAGVEHLLQVGRKVLKGEERVCG